MTKLWGKLAITNAISTGATRDAVAVAASIKEMMMAVTARAAVAVEETVAVTAVVAEAEEELRRSWSLLFTTGK